MSHCHALVRAQLSVQYLHRFVRQVVLKQVVSDLEDVLRQRLAAPAVRRTLPLLLLLSLVCIAYRLRLQRESPHVERFTLRTP